MSRKREFFIDGEDTHPNALLALALVKRATAGGGELERVARFGRQARESRGARVLAQDQRRGGAPEAASY